MDSKRLIVALSNWLPATLASDLVEEFVRVRSDAATKTLGRTDAGKFVETLVQVLQHLSAGRFDVAPKVDEYLDRHAVGQVSLDEGLRLGAARIGRAMYTLRNKRNIAHKNQIDPNSYDLEFLHAAARWVMAEMLRLAQGLTMVEAGALIDMVHAPVGQLVEEIDGRRLVHGSFTIGEEILVLLHSHHPDHVPVGSILESMDRRAEQSVRNEFPKLYRSKLIQGDTPRG